MGIDGMCTTTHIPCAEGRGTKSPKQTNILYNIYILYLQIGGGVLL